MKEYYDQVTRKRRKRAESGFNFEPSPKRLKKSDVVFMDFELKR